MINQSIISRRFILLCSLSLFNLGPVIGFGIYTFNNRPVERTKEQFSSAITRYFSDTVGQSLSSTISIKDTAKTEPYWYLVDYSLTGDDRTYSVLVGDFDRDASKLIVVSDPETGFARQNISELGVPYTLVDTIEKRVAKNTEHSD